MSSKTRLLVKTKDGKIRRLMNISYNDDGSIYFLFHRDNKYRLTNMTEHKFGENGEREIELDEVTNLYENLKLSFHPGKKVIHVMSEDRNDINQDHELYNSIDDNINEAYYLLQVIFPTDLSLLDEYKKALNDDCLIVDENMIDEIDQFSIEIIVHTDTITPSDPRVLPYSKDRKVYDYRRYNVTYGYTCSFFFCGREYSNECKNLILCVNTKESAIFYSLSLD